MQSFLSKVFGRKKDDDDISPSSLGPGELLGGKFEAISPNVSPIAPLSELEDAKVNGRDKDKGRDNKDFGFTIFRVKSRTASPDAKPKKTVPLPQLALNFADPQEGSSSSHLLDTQVLLADAVIGQRRLNPLEALVLIRTCSKAITARGLETLGLMHPHWYSASPDAQRRLISRYIQSLDAPDTSAFQSEVQFTRSPHDVAAVLRWGLRHLQLDGEQFGTDEGWYKAFLEGEAADGYPPKAFSEKLTSLVPKKHLDLLIATLEIFSTLAAHAESNSTSGSKLSKVFGLWLLTSRRIEDKEDWKTFYARWERMGRMLEHLFLAHIRDQSADQRLPSRLLELVQKYPYTNGLSSPNIDLSLLPRPRFTTALCDALFVRVEIDIPFEKRKSKSKLQPLNLVADAFSITLDNAEYAGLWTKIVAASKNGSDPSPLSSVFADETIRFLSIVEGETQEVRSPTFGLFSPSSPRDQSLSPKELSNDKPEASTPQQVKPAPGVSPISPLSAIGGDWAQFSTSGFFTDPGIPPLTSTLFDTDIEKTVPPDPVVTLSRRSSKRRTDSVKRKSVDLGRKDHSKSPVTILENAPEPVKGVVDVPKRAIRATDVRIVQLDEAFVDFWSDSLLDPVSSNWPSFIVCKLKGSLVPELTFGAPAEAGQEKKVLKWLVLERVNIVKAALPPPPLQIDTRIFQRPSLPSAISGSATRKRFSFWTISRTASSSSTGSTERKAKKTPKIGEMGELLEEEPKDVVKEKYSAPKLLSPKPRKKPLLDSPLSPSVEHKFLVKGVSTTAISPVTAGAIVIPVKATPDDKPQEEGQVSEVPAELPVEQPPATSPADKGESLAVLETEAAVIPETLEASKTGIVPSDKEVTVPAVETPAIEVAPLEVSPPAIKATSLLYAGVAVAGVAAALKFASDERQEEEASEGPKEPPAEKAPETTDVVEKEEVIPKTEVAAIPEAAQTPKIELEALEEEINVPAVEVEPDVTSAAKAVAPPITVPTTVDTDNPEEEIEVLEVPTELPVEETPVTRSAIEVEEVPEVEAAIIPESTHAESEAIEEEPLAVESVVAEAEEAVPVVEATPLAEATESEETLPQESDAVPAENIPAVEETPAQSEPEVKAAEVVIPNSSAEAKKIEEPEAVEETGAIEEAVAEPEIIEAHEDVVPEASVKGEIAVGEEIAPIEAIPAVEGEAHPAEAVALAEQVSVVEEAALETLVVEAVEESPLSEETTEGPIAEADIEQIPVVEEVAAVEEEPAVEEVLAADEAVEESPVVGEAVEESPAVEVEAEAEVPIVQEDLGKTLAAEDVEVEEAVEGSPVLEVLVVQEEIEQSPAVEVAVVEEDVPVVEEVSADVLLADAVEETPAVEEAEVPIVQEDLEQTPAMEEAVVFEGEVEDAPVVEAVEETPVAEASVVEEVPVIEEVAEVFVVEAAGESPVVEAEVPIVQEDVEHTFAVEDVAIVVEEPAVEGVPAADKTAEEAVAEEEEVSVVEELAAEVLAVESVEEDPVVEAEGALIVREEVVEPPAVEETAVCEEVSALEEDPVVEEVEVAHAVEEIAVVEEIPVEIPAEEAIAVEGVSVGREVAVVEELSVVEEIPAAEAVEEALPEVAEESREIPAVEVPVVEGVSVAEEDAPPTEEVSPVEEVLMKEGVIVEQGLAVTDVSAIEEVSVAEEVHAVDKAPAVEGGVEPAVEEVAVEEASSANEDLAVMAVAEGEETPVREEIAAESTPGVVEGSAPVEVEVVAEASLPEEPVADDETFQAEEMAAEEVIVDSPTIDEEVVPETAEEKSLAIEPETDEKIDIETGSTTLPPSEAELAEPELPAEETYLPATTASEEVTSQDSQVHSEPSTEPIEELTVGEEPEASPSTTPGADGPEAVASEAVSSQTEPLEQQIPDVPEALATSDHDNVVECTTSSEELKTSEETTMVAPVDLDIETEEVSSIQQPLEAIAPQEHDASEVPELEENIAVLASEPHTSTDITDVVPEAVAEVNNTADSTRQETLVETLTEAPPTLEPTQDETEQISDVDEIPANIKGSTEHTSDAVEEVSISDHPVPSEGGSEALAATEDGQKVQEDREPEQAVFEEAAAEATIQTEPVEDEADIDAEKGPEIILETPEATPVQPEVVEDIHSAAEPEPLKEEGESSLSPTSDEALAEEPTPEIIEAPIEPTETTTSSGAVEEEGAAVEVVEVAEDPVTVEAVVEPKDEGEALPPAENASEDVIPSLPKTSPDIVEAVVEPTEATIDTAIDDAIPQEEPAAEAVEVTQSEAKEETETLVTQDDTALVPETAPEAVESAAETATVADALPVTEEATSTEAVPQEVPASEAAEGVVILETQEESETLLSTQDDTPADHVLDPAPASEAEASTIETPAPLEETTAPEVEAASEEIPVQEEPTVPDAIEEAPADTQSTVVGPTEGDEQTSELVIIPETTETQETAQTAPATVSEEVHTSVSESTPIEETSVPAEVEESHEPVPVDIPVAEAPVDDAVVESAIPAVEHEEHTPIVEEASLEAPAAEEVVVTECATEEVPETVTPGQSVTEEVNTPTEPEEVSVEAPVPEEAAVTTEDAVEATPSPLVAEAAEEVSTFGVAGAAEDTKATEDHVETVETAVEPEQPTTTINDLKAEVIKTIEAAVTNGDGHHAEPSDMTLVQEETLESNGHLAKADVVVAETDSVVTDEPPAVADATEEA